MKVYVHGNELLEHFTERGDDLVVAGDAHASRQNVKRWLNHYCRRQDCDAVLVWDGTPPGEVRTPGEQFGRVQVTNLPHGESAFAEISGPANRTAVEERTFVVTSDHRLIDVLRPGRAAVFSAAQFVARARRMMGKTDEELAREPDQKFTGVSEDEVEFWVDFFNQDD